MKSTLKLLVLLLAASFTACNNKPIEEIQGFDYGTIKDNKYTNTFFNIKLNIPEGWQVQSREENKAMMDEGSELVAGDNATLKKAIKASEINTASLLTVFKYKMEEATGYNPNFMLVAENLKNSLVIKTGKDYLVQTKKMMAASKMQMQASDKFESVTINNLEFSTMEVTIQYEGLSIKQVYMATVKEGFAVGFIYSYTDENQKAEVEKVVNSIDTFKR